MPYEFEQDYINVVAIDSGSGSIKIGIASVSPGGTVNDVIYDNLPIKLAQDLEEHILMKEINKSGQIQNLYDISGLPLNMCALFDPDLDQGQELLNTIKPMCSKEAYEFLQGGYSNKFSEAIKETYLNKLTEAVKLVKGLDSDHETQVWLVGTASLRKADDGQLLINELAEKMEEELGVTTDFKVISQEEEGIYAFEGAVYYTKLPAEKIISWDIGGGSMQITGKQDDSYTVLGGTVASSTFKTMMMNKLIGDGVKEQGESLIPLDSKQISKMIELAKEKVSFEAEKEEWLQNKKAENGVTVIGVGNIHKAISDLINTITGKDAASYNKQDVMNVIKFIVSKTEEELKAYIPKTSEEFVGNYLPNAILIESVMEKYGIDKVQAIEVSNTLTLANKVASQL